VFGKAFLADGVVLGGGNAARLGPLPAGMRRGGNENVFEGGFRLWRAEVAHLDRAGAVPAFWQVVYRGDGHGAVVPAPSAHKGGQRAAMPSRSTRRTSSDTPKRSRTIARDSTTLMSQS
jgi:hypothetical protein